MGRKGLLLPSIMIIFFFLMAVKIEAQESDSVEIVGFLETLAVDQVDAATGILKGGFIHYLKTEEGKVYQIEDPKGILRRRPSGGLSLRAIRRGNKLAVEEVTPQHLDLEFGAKTDTMAAEPQPDTIGEQRVLVALFNFPDKPSQPFTLKEIQDRIINNSNSVDHFIRENSYGQTWLTADFMDWESLPHQSAYYTGSEFRNKLLDGAIMTLDPTVDFQKYGRLVFIFVHNDAYSLCALGDLAKRGLNSPGDGHFTASVIWIDEACPEATAAGMSSIISHEFGHNLGFWHASSVLTIPESLTDPTYSGGDCEEYGDSDDTMGLQHNYRHYSSIWKSQARWIEASQIEDVITSGEYILDQIELPSSGSKALRIPLGKDEYNDDIYYWIEYRNNIGTFDKEDSVQIRFKDGKNSIRYKSLTTGSSILGRVTRDSDGTGMGNLRIDLYDASWNTAKSAYTDSSGIYRLSVLPTGHYYVGTWNDQGYIDEYYDTVTSRNAASSISVTQSSNTSNINFGLSNMAGSISGRVTRDSNGTGMENVRIDLYEASWNTVKSTYTDSSGNYRVSGLAPGNYYVGAWSEGYVEEYYKNVISRNEATLVSVTQGSETPNINFGLAMGGSISGRVIRNSNGTGMENVRIDLYEASWNKVESTYTDSSGNYRVGGLATGNYYVGTWNDQGYRDEYYDNVTSRDAATPVKVIQDHDVLNINLGLALGAPTSTRKSGNADRTEAEESHRVAYDGIRSSKPTAYRATSGSLETQLNLRILI